MTPTSDGRAHHSPRRIIAAAALVLFCCFTARAQQGELTPPKVEVKATFGGAGFGEDADIPHVAGGGAVRIYLTRRLSVEPEFLYMRNGENDQDSVFTPSLAVDLRDPTERVVPYLIGGVGALHHRGRFFGSDFGTGQPRVFDRSFTTWSAGFGGDVKIYLTDRLFVAPDARVGHEPTARATISLGYVLSGRRR